MEAIDLAAKIVRGNTLNGEDFQVEYDKLLIATGATPIIPDINGIDLPGVMTLKNLEDGRKIKGFIHEEKVEKAVFIGMGYIALEMC